MEPIITRANTIRRRPRGRAGPRFAVATQAAGLAAGLGVCTIAGAPAAEAQEYPPPATTSTTLPNTGVSLNVGDLRATLPRSFEEAGGTAKTPSWTFVPAIDLEEEATDNLFYTPGKGRSDLITLVTPSLAIAGDTQRLRVNLNYAPTVSFYARTPSQNQVAQQFNGAALATIIPDALFLDVRGLVSTQSISGARGLSGGPTLSPQSEAQTLDFSATPYLQHRFGGWGTAEIGYTISRGTISTSASTPTVNLFAPAPASNVNAALTTQSEHVSFVTGENLGRTQSAFEATATEYSSSQELSGTRDVVTDDLSYGLTHRITLIGRIGYESIHYDTQPPVRIDDVVWGAGVHLTPNPDSTITVRYGHQDGFNSLFLDAAYTPSEKTQVFARYTEGLTSELEDLQNALSSASLDPYGNPVDQSSGAPILPVDNFFGIQNGLYRLRRYSATGLLTLPRDALSASVDGERETLVAETGTTTAATGPTNGVYGIVNWTHTLSPSLQSGLSAEYGTRSVSSGPGVNISERLITVTASLRYLLSQTVSLRIEYNFSKVLSDQPGLTVTANTAFIGVHKQF